MNRSDGAVCPHYVAAINAPGVHVILCCDGQRMSGQLVNAKCGDDIEEHVRRRCCDDSWESCPYVKELAYVHEPLGVAVCGLLRACLRGQPPVERRGGV